MKLENNIIITKAKGGVWELMGVILQLILSFVNDNFIKSGSFSTKGLLNPIFYIRCFALIWKIAMTIKTFKLNYTVFQQKYLTPVEYNLSKLNNFLN